MRLWPRRRPRGRHALGAAVTAIPSAPVTTRAVVAPAAFPAAAPGWTAPTGVPVPSSTTAWGARSEDSPAPERTPAPPRPVLPALPALPVQRTQPVQPAPPVQELPAPRPMPAPAELDPFLLELEGELQAPTQVPAQAPLQAPLTAVPVSPAAAAPQPAPAPTPVAPPPSTVVFTPSRPHVELGFADGSVRRLDPASSAAQQLSDLVAELTARDTSHGASAR